MKRRFIVAFICLMYAFTSKAQNEIIDSKNVKFNDSIFTVSRPKGYNYFKNSIFKDKSIEEFSKSTLSPYKINHFDFFIPDELEKNLQ